MHLKVHIIFRASVYGGVRHHDGEGTFVHLTTLMASTRRNADGRRGNIVIILTATNWSPEYKGRASSMQIVCCPRKVLVVGRFPALAQWLKLRLTSSLEHHKFIIAAITRKTDLSPYAINSRR